METRQVKCKYCEELFDKEIEPFVRAGYRYYHKECYEAHLYDLTQLRQLADMINEVYENWNREPNWSLITRQIKKFRAAGLTYETLVDRMTQHLNSTSFDLDKAYGVGFLGYEPCDFNIKTKDEALTKLLESYLPETEEEQYEQAEFLADYYMEEE